MGVCLAFELLQCAGKHLDSSAASAHDAPPQVSNEEASSSQFLPAEGTSAALISPHRLLVTGGMLQDERVLPFSVIRYLDFDPRSDHAHRWSRPTLLRPPSQRGGAAKKTRRVETPIPVCRVDHTLTMVPTNAKLYLIGGMKVGGKDDGMSCTTMFAFDSKSKTWDSIEPVRPSSRVKEDPNGQLGPRFSHTATYVSYTPKCSSSRQKARAKPAPFIYVYGGFKQFTSRQPVSDIHIFDVKKCKWSLAIPAPSAVKPPGLANHAAALTPCGKYIAYHGGILSDLNDYDAMSDGLFLFDVQNQKWLEPKLHGNSDKPPSARTQHSLVSGVGRHRGSLVMYGGCMKNETFSKEMFLCKILEPEHPDQQIEVFWQGVQVRTTVPRLLPDDPNHESNKLLSERSAAISGGCMVSLPDLGKYVIVGGKTAYGLRKSPLMLDPLDSDENVTAQSVEMPEGPPGIEVIENQAADVAPKTADAPRSPLSPRERCTDMNDNLNAPVIDDDYRQVVGRSPSPAEGGIRIPRASSLQRTSSEKSPVRTAAAREKASAGSLGSDRLRKRKPRMMMSVEPSPKIIPASCNVVQPASNPRERKTRSDLLKEANALLIKSQRIRSSRDNGNADRLCPPLKKRRLRSDTKKVEEPELDEANCIISPAPLAGDPAVEGNGDRVPDDAAVPLSMSARSEFIAPSEIKRIGRTNTTKGNGGRGRAATIRQKQAELDASNKKIEAQEETIRRSVSEIAKLREENNGLKGANRHIKIDNRGLNEQVQNLLQEVQSLRNHAAAHQASDTGVESHSAPTPMQDESVPKHAASSNEDSVTAPLSAAKSGKVQEIKTYQGNAESLQDAIRSEKEALLQELRECEEDRRHVESELNRTRNLLDRSQNECGKLRAKANDCEKAMKDVFTDRESLQTKLTCAENDIVTLKSKNETLNLNLMDEKHKLGRVVSERKAREEQVRKLQSELAEQLKKFGDNDGKQRMLLVDLEAQKSRIEELNRFVNEKTEKVAKMQEKCAEVATERDTLRSQFNEKVRDHEAALVVTDKDKASMDKLRKDACDRMIEQKRVKRELDARTRECGKLRAKLGRLQASYKSVWPLIARISKEMDQTMRECEAVESDDGIPSPEVVTGEVAEAEAVVVEEEAQGVAAAPTDMQKGAGEGGREKGSTSAAKEIPESDEAAAEDEEEP